MKKLTFIVLFSIASLLACKKDCPDQFISMNNLGPTIRVTPEGYSGIVGDTVRFSAITTDTDGKVEAVVFYKDGYFWVADSTMPYEQDFVCDNPGTTYFSVFAIDDDQTNSRVVKFEVDCQQSQYPKISLNISDELIYDHDSIAFEVVSSSDVKIEKIELFVSDRMVYSDTAATTRFVMDSLPIETYTAYAIVYDQKQRQRISAMKEFEVRASSPPKIEIDVRSYYNFFPGTPIRIDVNGSDVNYDLKDLLLYCNGSLIDHINDFHFLNADYVPTSGGVYSFHAVGRDSRLNLGYSDTIEVQVAPGISIENRWTDLSLNNQGTQVFGLDKERNRLILANLADFIVDEKHLPFSNPIKFEYSENDDKLYIIYSYSGAISVWNNQSQSFTQITFSSTADAIDIEIDKLNQRIYLLATDGIYIIDMNNNNIIGYSGYNNVIDIAVDRNNHWLFAISLSSTNKIELSKYSIQNDELILLQFDSSQYFYRGEMLVNEEEGYIVVPGYSENNRQLVISSSNIEDVIGAFSNNLFVYRLCLSPDKSLILATDSDAYNDKIDVFDAKLFHKVTEIDVPNSGNALYEINMNNDKLVVTSYREYGDITYTYLVFIDL